MSGKQIEGRIQDCKELLKTSKAEKYLAYEAVYKNEEDARSLIK